jgi:hypothetical protein
MGSGKTTVADTLVSTLSFQKIALAGTLKSMLKTFLKASGLSEFVADAAISDPELKETPMAVLNGKTPRYAMQTLGTEWGRELFGEDFWVNSAIGRAKRHMDQGTSVVIDDVRFPNEADAIKEAGGYMVRVFRPGQQITQRHASEGGLDEYPVDFVLMNHSTEDVLQLASVGMARYLSATRP